MKVIEVIADGGHADTIRGIAEQYAAEDVWIGAPDEDGRVASRLLVAPDSRQQVLDSLQSILSTAEGARILVLPVEASLPKPGNDEDDRHRRKGNGISREELFDQVSKGARLDGNFVLLVVLSGIVAGIGMLENNVAVIVGAMVIAPLLGPNIAFSLATSLGERELALESLSAIAVGVLLAMGTGFATGLLWPSGPASTELLLRTDVSYAGTAIALASGAAASLSLLSSVSSVLVGVMVAVALMPPAVTIGLMLSLQDGPHALGALLLLAVNIVCINLAAKLVFLLRGVRPRSWLESRKARQSQVLHILVWIVLLGALITAIAVRRG